MEPGVPRFSPPGGKKGPLAPLAVRLLLIHHPDECILTWTGEIGPNSAYGDDTASEAAIELHPRSARIHPGLTPLLKAHVVDAEAASTAGQFLADGHPIFTNRAARIFLLNQ